MISTVIVVFTMVLALAFSLAYALNPELRRKVEAPKYVFLSQLAQYDQALRQGQGLTPDQSKRETGESGESGE